MNPPPDPPSSSSPPPPPPPPRSYAAASAGSSSGRVHPPPVPPKPASMSPRAQQQQQPAAIAPTSFFGPASSPAPSSSAAPVPSSSGAFRPATTSRRGSKPSPSAPPPIELSSSDEDDELRLKGAPVPPAAPLKKRSPPVTKTYGSSGPRRARAESGAGADGGQAWDDEWMQPAPAPAPAAAPAPAPRAWGTPAWGPRTHDADAEVRVVPASPSPPPPLPPTPPGGSEQRLLQWAPPAQAPWPIGLPQGEAWTVPRVLALEGERGLAPALWDASVWDLEVAETPVGTKAGKDVLYREMGEWVTLGGAGAPRSAESSAASQATATAQAEDTPMATAPDAADDKPLPIVEDGAVPSSPSGAPPPAPPPKPATPPPPVKGFHTITRAELTSARPHPHLYFCRSTLSWALFAPVLRASPPAAAAPDEPALWTAAGQPVDPSQLERYLSERFCTLSGLPPLPAPLAPADADQFSQEHDPATEANVPSLSALGTLVELHAHEGSAVVSVSGTGFFPAVIPRKLWARLMRARGAEPPLGMTADEARWEAARLIWRTIDNGLFAGETRAVTITGKTFSKYMPWDAITNDIFIATLGFRLSKAGSLSLPHLDAADEAGRANRARLLRCWLEIGLWMEDFVKRHADKVIKRPATRITLKPARPALAAAMGGDDLPRAPQVGEWSTVTSSRAIDDTADDTALAGDYTLLGATPDLADRVLARVYDLQRARDWTRTPVLLEALLRLSTARASPALQEKVALERSLERFPASEVVAAFGELRLGDPFKAYITEEEVLAAFERRNAAVEHKDRRRVLFQQARVVASFTDNQTLRAILESMGDEAAAVGAGPATKPRMDLDAANRALGIETDMDDSIISTLYEIRLADASTDTEKAKMREALEVIADARDSSELRTLAKTGKRDEEGGWQAAVTVDTNLPVGLTNIANTCYLNSLLQYFFTVRELRDTILAFHDAPTPPSQAEAQLRVGGRLVSLAEVKRSKRFVALLQTLYQQLIHAPVSAVTPETELAYLALVPSKEEADAAAAAPAAAAQLTEEPEPLESAAPATAKPDIARSPTSSSVLGKRKNGSDGATTVEAPTSPAAASQMQLDSQAAPLSSPSLAAGGARLAGLSLSPSADVGEDAEMADGDAEGDARRVKRGKSEEERSGASSATEVQRSPASDAEEGVAAAEEEEAMSLDVPPEEDEGADAPPPLPPRRTPLAPSPEPPALLGPEQGGQKDKEKELERQVSTYMAFGRQNDVTECMDNVMFQVEAALLANAANGQAQETATLLRRTFYGTMRQQLVFDDPSSVPDPVRTQDEPFSSLLVDVAPSASSSASGALARDIYDGLDAVFAPSPITLEGHAAQRRVALVAPPPPVLQIQLQRVQYDREKQSVYKSNAHLQFYEEIGVARYAEVAEGDEEGRERQRRTGELRAELERTRERLAQLTKDKSTNTATVLRSTSSHFSHLSSLPPSSPFGLPASLTNLLNTSLFDDTEAEAAALEAEIDALQSRVGELREEIKRVWSDKEEQTTYELTAVFIHRGTALSGHYYIYQRDHRNPQRWLRYNDSVVSEVDKDEVFRETTGDTNAYFLAYVRKDCQDAIESIKREP
ncbi:ubiquitin-specific protease ubp2 [Rhodotorula kratochvilovae]